jgi:D-glycero-D-manno-heptose 1,7-bisphosphate phosphatase
VSRPTLTPFSAVFLDRDGVINVEDGIISDPGQLRLIEGSGEAIARLNRLKLPVIVVTNQPVVARGWVSEADVDKLHDHLRDLLSEHGASLDAIYFCPHHENANDPNYRRICDCRKPRPGMLLQATRDLRLDPEKCILIGDRTVDLQAAREAGCQAYLVKTGFAGKDGKCDTEPDMVFNDLLAAVNHIEKCKTINPLT